MYFSKNLKILRVSKRFKQAELDEELGLGKNSTSNYELGRNNPTLETLIKVADYFSVSIDALLRQDMATDGTTNKDVGNHSEEDSAQIECLKQTIKAQKETITALKETIAAQRKTIEAIEARIK